MKINYQLKKLVTMAVGGPAKYFVEARNENSLIKAVNFAKEKKINWRVVGDGSNLIPSDAGFDGLVIRNKVTLLEKNGLKVTVASGQNFLNFVFTLNRLGLAGIEKMAGIPGTVGGAIYGSAGAYGQEIKDNLIRVKIFDGKGSYWLSRKECEFYYRESIFKKKRDWIILGAEFKFHKDSPKKLQQISKEIIRIREMKYKPGLACPGSFFKNIILAKLKPDIRSKLTVMVGKEKIKLWHGKISVAWLLEQVGAKGMALGKIKVADYHANLIYNSGDGTSRDIEKISKILKNRVRDRFGIVIEEEVQFL